MDISGVFLGGLGVVMQPTTCTGKCNMCECGGGARMHDIYVHMWKKTCPYPKSTACNNCLGASGLTWEELSGSRTGGSRAGVSVSRQGSGPRPAFTQDPLRATGATLRGQRTGVFITFIFNSLLPEGHS